MPTASRTRRITIGLMALAVAALPWAHGAPSTYAGALGESAAPMGGRAAVERQAPTATTTPTATPAPIPNDVQRLTAGLPSDGFAGTPCANAANATCQINSEDPPGGVDGTARVAADGMTVSVTVQPGLVPPGAVANVFFPTTFGIENVDCPAALAGGPLACNGTAIANLIQGSTVRVFAGNVQVATAQVVGPGAATATPLPSATATAIATATAVPTATLRQ
jgi:hypothetical protein